MMLSHLVGDRKHRTRRGDSAELHRARALVMKHGWNATCYQIINPGIDLWFSQRFEAVVGYVPRNHVRVVAGAPVCAEADLPGVVAELEADARDNGEDVCFFGAEARLESVLTPLADHSMVRLGAQPAWVPTSWPRILAGRASLRAQLNRARNKNVAVEEWPPARAASAPELQRCLDEWLASRPLPPMHFLIEPETLERLHDRRIFVACRDAAVVGFLVASPVPTRAGWLVEQIIRGAEAPNGTAELLIDAAFRTLARDGAGYLTLGLAPLSRFGGDQPRPAPRWLAWTLRWVRSHGRRFYNFAGLESFKAKFVPDRWEPIYAVANREQFGVRTLYAIAAAFSGISPVVFLARATIDAIATEIRWALRGSHDDIP